MNPDLLNLLFKPTLYIENIPQYYEDDFDLNKRKNRLFTAKQKEQCWNKARLVDGRHPDRWRYDAVGNIVSKALKGCHGPLCHEYDHVVPFSKGGETTVRNCQILQTNINRYKSNKTGLYSGILVEKSSKISMSSQEMDLIEMAIYGNVKKL